ncbi:MAG: helix-turn-helix domain-containing protein, partial [Pseudomonadota bacterium]
QDDSTKNSDQGVPHAENCDALTDQPLFDGSLSDQICAADATVASAKFPSPDIPIGERLRQARQSLGLSKSDVASRLKLMNSYVEAIEAGTVEDLPAATFARGFVRSYASLVKIDEDAAVADFNLLIGKHGQMASQPFVVPEPMLDSRLPGHKAIFAGLALMLMSYTGWQFVAVPAKAPLASLPIDLVAASDFSDTPIETASAARQPEARFVRTSASPSSPSLDQPSGKPKVFGANAARIERSSAADDQVSDDVEVAIAEPVATDKSLASPASRSTVSPYLVDGAILAAAQPSLTLSHAYPTAGSGRMASSGTGYTEWVAEPLLEDFATLFVPEGGMQGEPQVATQAVEALPTSPEPAAYEQETVAVAKVGG